jgi:hypothetical protein
MAAAVVMLSFATSLFGQKLAVPTKGAATSFAVNSSVQPVFFQGPGDSGNPDCSDLNALHVNGVGDTTFSHIVEDRELKLDFGTPNGAYPFTTGSGRFVVGTQYPDKSLTVASTGSTVTSWSSSIQITAVILKIGSDAYVYPYKPFATSDTNLVTGDNRSISHLTFCFSNPANPTAADVALNGRVIDASGNGIAKAQIVLIDGATGESKITLTNPFGYYAIQGLKASELYVLNVSHKRYSFTEPQRTVVLTDNFTGTDFVAQP